MHVGPGRKARPLRRLWTGVALAFGLVVPSIAAAAEEPHAATAWVSEHATRVRLVAGGTLPMPGPAAGGSVAGGVAPQPRLLAGIEITLDDGWKTYWRNPGSSGVPPRVEWTGSENLAAAELMFPAPTRFPDRDGDTIGYKSHVVLPVAITPKNAALPVKLRLSLEYGVCREVCVPVQPVLELTVAPEAAAKAAGSALTTAVARVPRDVGRRREGDPALANLALVLTGDKPHILVDGTFPGAAGAADVFMEAPDGLWLPLAKPIDGGAAGAGKRRFHVDLTDGADLKDLAGRTIRLTLVGERGAAETTFVMK